MADNQNESDRSFSRYVSYSLSQINALISEVSERHSDAKLQIPAMQFQSMILVWNIFQYFGTLQSFCKCSIVTRSKVEKSQNRVKDIA